MHKKYIYIALALFILLIIICKYNIKSNFIDSSTTTTASNTYTPTNTSTTASNISITASNTSTTASNDMPIVGNTSTTASNDMPIVGNTSTTASNDMPIVGKISPAQTIALLNNGLSVDMLSSRGIMINSAFRGPTTNIVQSNLTGTSNIYSPYLHYNKGSNEHFLNKIEI